MGAEGTDLVMAVQAVNKSVAIVWHGHFPWNRGVGCLAKTLNEQGWRVILLTRNVKCAVAREKLSYAEIYRVPGPKEKIFGRLLYYHSPISPGWISFIYRTCKRNRVSLLIVRDLPLAFMTGLVAKWLGIPVALDMREYYPAFVASAPNKRGIRRITKSRVLNDKLETLSLKCLDRVFVVVPEVKGKLLRKGFNPRKVDVFCYFPRKPRFDMPKALNLQDNGKTRFVYAGSVDQRRDLLGVLEAFAILKRQNYEFELCVVANQSRERSALEARSRELGLESVVFKDLFPAEEVVDSLRAFDVGIINHKSCEHTESTLPMKLFEYMAAGLAVLASDVTPIRRVIDKEKCGLVFRSAKPAEIADTLAKVILDREMTKDLGENAFHAVLRKYNWEMQSKLLVQAIDELVRK